MIVKRKIKKFEKEFLAFEKEFLAADKRGFRGYDFIDFLSGLAPLREKDKISRR